jgi:hypothetical protein
MCVNCCPQNLHISYRCQRPRAAWPPAEDNRATVSDFRHNCYFDRI